MLTVLAPVIHPCELGSLALDRAARVVVLPLNSVAYHESVNAGHEILNPNEPLERSGRLARLPHAFADLIDAWRTHARIEFEGIDLLGLAGFRHTRALARAILHAASIEAAIEALAPDAIIGLDAPPDHLLDRPAHADRLDALHRIFAARAAEHGIEWIGRAPTAASCGAGPAEQAAADDAPGERLRRFVSGGHLLLSGNGHEVRSLACAAAQTGARCVIVSKVTPTPFEHPENVIACSELSYLDASGVASEHPQLDIDCGSIRSQLIADGRSSLVFAGGALDGHLEFLCGGYARAMASHVRTWRAVFAGGCVDAVVTAYPSPVLDVAATEGVPTLMLPHGPAVMNTPMLTALAPSNTVLGAIGRWHADDLGRLHGKERVAITGVPGSSFSAAEPSVTYGRSPAEGLRILIPSHDTDRPPHAGMLPRARWDHEMRTLRCLSESAVAARGWSLAVRPHPRFDRPESFYRALMGEAMEWSPASERTLEEAVGAADVIVFVNPVSSAVLDVSAMGVPVVLCEHTMMSDRLRDFGLEEWPHATCDASLIRMLDGMRTDTEVFEQTAQQTREAFERFRGVSADPLGELAAGAIRRVARPTTRGSMKEAPACQS